MGGQGQGAGVVGVCGKSKVLKCPVLKLGKQGTHGYKGLEPP